jgi:hypothetical protein
MTPEDDSMLDPEEYTVSVEFAPLPTEQVYMADTVKRAMEGDTAAVTIIYSDFVSAIDLLSEKSWSAKVPWPYVRFVADRLRAVLETDLKSADVAVALGITPGTAGVPEGSTKYDPRAIAAFYYRLLWAGIEPKDAKFHMRESIGVSDDVIEKAARDHAGLEHPDQFKSTHPDIRGTYFQCLEQLAAPYQVTIAEILAALKLRRP